MDRFLDSNDTFGIRWLVNIGSMFDKLIFDLTDAHRRRRDDDDLDGGAPRRCPRGLGEREPSARGGGLRRPVNSAEITLLQPEGEDPTGSNDGFSLDDIAVSPVPLPAPAFMLIAGLAGLAAFRRKRAAA